MSYRKVVEVLIQALEDHPELLDYPQTNSQAMKNIWKSLASKLNAQHKFKSALTPKRIKRKWADLKYRVKKKAYLLEKAKSEKGGEMPNTESNLTLSPIEERVLKLLKSKNLDRFKAPSLTIKDQILLQAPSSSINSIVPSGPILPSPSRAPSSSINSSVPSGPILLSPSHISATQTRFRKILPAGYIPVQTIPIIKEEIIEIGEIETEQPPVDFEIEPAKETETEPPDESEIEPPDILTEMDETNTSNESPLPVKSQFYSKLYASQKVRMLMNKQKKRVKKTEFETLADIEERKLALLEEQINIKRKNLAEKRDYHKKKCLIMEKQLAAYHEQLSVSKEQLAISKQILQLKINQSLSNRTTQMAYLVT